MRRETGREQGVKVHYDEGVANRIGPELCGFVREGTSKASAGVRIGQPLSRESKIIPDADAVDAAEGKTGEARHRERPPDPAWSETLACA
jgi:hypothetical protein